LPADVIEGEAHSLGDADERDAAQHVAVEAALPALGARAADESGRLVETHSRVRDAGAFDNFSDSQVMFHLTSS